MRRRVLQVGALALLAGLAAGLALALLHRPAGGRVDLESRPLTVRGQLSPQDPQFGDTVVATLDVYADPSVDADSIRVRSAFGPYAVASRTRSVRSVGGVSVVRVVSRLRCLELACVPPGRVRTFRFGLARISYQRGSAARDVLWGWPKLRVHSRVTTADVTAPVLRVPPPVAAPAHYRVSPAATAYVLFVLAGLLGVGGAGLLLSVGLRKIAAPRRRVAPLERVLGELAASCSNGDSGRRRRALEDLARELEPLDEPLSEESRVLAWGPDDPRPEAISELTDRVRTEVPR
jgi:hypothetical protein